MKVIDLKTGEYFFKTTIAKGPGIVARKTDNVVYLNSPKVIFAQACTNAFYDTMAVWGDIDVEPIDFKQAIAYLVQECIELNELQSTDSTQKADPKTLPNGQYFLTNQENIGRIYKEGLFIFVTENQPDKETKFIWNWTQSIKTPVFPLSMNSAILFLAAKTNLLK